MQYNAHLIPPIPSCLFRAVNGRKTSVNYEYFTVIDPFGYERTRIQLVLFFHYVRGFPGRSDVKR